MIILDEEEVKSSENLQQEPYIQKGIEQKRVENAENIEEKEKRGEIKTSEDKSERNISPEREKKEESVEIGNKEPIFSPKKEQRRSVSPKKEAGLENLQDEKERKSEKIMGKGERSSSAGKARTKSTEEKPGRKRKSKKELINAEENPKTTRKDRKVNKDEYDKYAQLLNQKTHRKKSSKS